MTITKIYTSKFDNTTLFNAWVSPKMIIPPVTKIEADLKVGGKFILYSESSKGTSKMAGKFLEIVNGQKLKYVWQWEGSEEKTIVTVLFNYEGDKNKILITHEGFLTKESAEMHSSGWDHYFSELENLLSNN